MDIQGHNQYSMRPQHSPPYFWICSLMNLTCAFLLKWLCSVPEQEWNILTPFFPSYPESQLYPESQSSLWSLSWVLCVCMCVCVCVCAESFSYVQLFATLWTIACQAPLSMEFFQEIILEQIAISYSKGSSQPRDQTRNYCISYPGRQIVYHCGTWEAFLNTVVHLIHK